MNSWESGQADIGAVDPNTSVRREVLMAHGGFDESFTRARHPCELYWRLTGAGVRFSYDRRAVAHQIYVKSAERLVNSQVRWRGRNEIPLFRKHLDKRPLSTLAAKTVGPFWKRFLNQIAASFPVSPDLVLRPCFGLTHALRSWPPMRRLGIALLRHRMTVSFLRGVAETASWRQVKAEFGQQLAVLTYHHVGRPLPNTNSALSVSPKQFERQIRYLAKRGYTAIRPADWLEWLRHGKPLPRKPILLTFDDAFAELSEFAFPVLERYGFSGTVFVVTDCIGKANVWDRHRGWTLRPCMTDEQIRHWARRGIDFGAHTRSHPDLTKCNAAKQRDEMSGSQRDLEQLVGSRVISLAYPYGDHDALAAACAGEYFELAFTCDEGLNTLGTDPRLLRRTMVFNNTSPLELDLIARLGWNPIHRVRGMLRVRSRLRALGRLLIGSHG
jgi:peptidoglycan/xylan/chitin deacetylase (PgdA/CDA1 family)